ncbi:MAG: MATE family efflux transporter [Oscillospiraceae bacterium]|nr:MATE family efflux transporter [Oscillospiraceae bacterium]
MACDLTKGKESKVIFKFTAPMFISVLFQQMYSIADSLIAGRFAGVDALAAVGASFPITNIFNAIAVGCNIGCGVVIAQYFGGRKYEKVKTTVSTSIISAIVLGALLTVFGIVFTPAVMSAIDTPQNIFNDSALYMKIYVAGFIFLFIYNISNGIFNALGDSKISLYFLIFSSVFNVILDYVLVARFNMGVMGVAWATFIAQGIAGILSTVTLIYNIKKLPTAQRPELFSFNELKKIGSFSVPSILQQSFVSVGNVFVQRLINGFGSATVAGFSAAMKLNLFAINILATFGNGVSSFTAQNVGAKSYGRLKKGMKYGNLMAFSTGVVVAIVYVAFATPLLQLFMDESGGAEAVKAGVMFLTIVSPFFSVIPIKLVCDGYLRGIGYMKLFMVATFTDLILRVILAYIFSPIWGFKGIACAWPVGWCAAMVLSVIFYKYSSKKILKENK